MRREKKLKCFKLKTISGILGWVVLTFVLWAIFDIWIHDYGIMPYYRYGVIISARDAYLYGFWTFAILNIIVISIVTKAWRYFVSLMLLMVGGAEDVMYYVLLPTFNPTRAATLNGFMPAKLPWLNDNLWLRLFSAGETVTARGIFWALGITTIGVVVFLLITYIPNLFNKEPLPSELPLDLIEAVEEVRSTNNKKQALEKAYVILTAKYRGYKFMTYLKLWLLWEVDLNKIWRRSGFLHCTSMNYLLRILLVKSGWFTEDDIHLAYSLIWYISIHQYLKVRLAERKWINVDIWYHYYGKGLGEYGHGFYA